MLSRQEPLKAYLGDKAGRHFGRYANLAFRSPAEHAYCRSGHCAHDFGADLLSPPGLHLLIIAFVPRTRYDWI